MKISEHIISNENGTEYFNIFFKVSNQTDLTFEQYNEIEYLIYKKLNDYKNEIKEIEKINYDTKRKSRRVSKYIYEFK
jgi:hypothetical protein